MQQSASIILDEEFIGKFTLGESAGITPLRVALQATQ